MYPGMHCRCFLWTALTWAVTCTSSVSLQTGSAHSARRTAQPPSEHGCAAMLLWDPIEQLWSPVPTCQQPTFRAWHPNPNPYCVTHFFQPHLAQGVVPAGTCAAHRPCARRSPAARRAPGTPCSLRRTAERQIVSSQPWALRAPHMQVTAWRAGHTLGAAISMVKIAGLWHGLGWL